jgi:ATP-dependent Clp protease protease subunit
MKNTCKDILIIGTGGTGLTASAFTALAQTYPLVITAEAKDTTAEIKISGIIYDWNNSAEEITAKIDEFIAAGIKDVNVYINSPGGDVFQAAEIHNQLQRFTGAKKGYGGAIVASAATMLAVELDTFEMADNGQFMYHKPSARLSGNENEIASGLKLLQNLSSQYKEMYAAKTGIPAEDIEANWAKGDVWLSAKEALEQKFITGIIKKNAPITKETKALFQACGSPTIPKITNHKKTLKTMDQKILALSLGLPEDASEETIKATILANKNTAGELAVLKAEKATKEAEIAATNHAEIEALINKAIFEKKVTTAQAEGLRGWAKTNVSSCMEYVKTLVPLAKVSAAIIPGSEGKTKVFAEMSDDEKQTLASEDPDAFKAAYIASLEVK